MPGSIGVKVVGRRVVCGRRTSFATFSGHYFPETHFRVRLIRHAEAETKLIKSFKKKTTTDYQNQSIQNMFIVFGLFQR